uniref:Uncharacterized protein n=1 Tax=Arundo donax TaxID=35708 RepID=A0A0A9HM19_ARUDO
MTVFAKPQVLGDPDNLSPASVDKPESNGQLLTATKQNLLFLTDPVSGT